MPEWDLTKNSVKNQFSEGIFMRMNKSIQSALAALVVVAAPFAFAQNVAVVNGTPIPKAKLDALSHQAARSGRQLSEDELRNQAIARAIFIQEASSRGLDASDDFKEQMELARESILINELFVDYQKKNPVSDEEAKTSYDGFVAANAGKEYKAHHILVATEKEANDLIAKLKKGAKFEDLAKKNSMDPGSKANGGDLGWASPNGYVKEFSDALIALQKGKYTTVPVKTQFGYHVIRMDDARDAAPLPKFEDVKPQIVQQLQQQKMQQFQMEMRAKAKIE